MPSSMRAYFVHCENGGERPKCSAFGDYVEWSRFIREPLLWLGEPDPVSTNKEIKNEDPEREKNINVFRAILDAFPDRTPRLVKYIIKETLLDDKRELRAALLSSRNHENIDPNRLGGWLGSKMDVQVDGMTLRKEGTRRPVAWFIEGGVAAEAQIQEGATSRAAPCQGRGTTFADLGTMPTGACHNSSEEPKVQGVSAVGLDAHIQRDTAWLKLIEEKTPAKPRRDE
jgi:hypothetical protein